MLMQKSLNLFHLSKLIEKFEIANQMLEKEIMELEKENEDKRKLIKQLQAELKELRNETISSKNNNKD